MILHRRLRAPREDGALLADPPLDAVGSFLARPLPDISLWDRSLRDWRARARREVLAAASAYLAEKGEIPPSFDVSAPLVMDGHQPELFHPGVWIKNFAIHQIAARHGATPLHLIVDNDTIKSTSLRVPAWHGSDPFAKDAGCHLATIAFDEWTGEMPHEERGVVDEHLFASFPQRLTEVTQSWGYQPLAARLWPMMSSDARLDERISAGRRGIERSWGCVNLEVPLSRVCATDVFGEFAVSLIGDMERFVETYNDCVREYRHVHGIRSRNHPVPDLLIDGAWHELPFWIWRVRTTRRGRLFARRVNSGVELRAEEVSCGTIRLDAGDLRRLTGDGWKLRTRALTTTLFSRLFLADVFLHGIGGGKYDEVTDELIQRYFRMPPPPFVVLSATVLLPLGQNLKQGNDVMQLARLQRDLYWNPQRHMESTASPLIDDKQAWIDRVPIGKAEKRERYAKLRTLTDSLRPFVDEQMHAVGFDLDEARGRRAARDILERRDYSICLYPEELLRGFYESARIPRDV